MKLLWVAAGAAAGYVLGAKAGRERYDQIMAAAREWRSTPPVSDAMDAAATVAERGKDAVSGKVSEAAAKVKSAVGERNGMPKSETSFVG